MPQDPTTVVTRRDLIFLASSIFVGALAIRLICFTGLIGSDDMSYVGFARQIAEGTYQLQPQHQGVRYGVIVPVAAMYRLFGLHEWTTVALPLICSSAAAMLVALVAVRVSGLSAGWVAGALMATFPVEVRYASILVPEPMLQAAVLSGALLFLLAERQRSAILGLVAGLCLGLAYLTKEAGALVVLAFVVFAVLRKEWQLAVSVALGAALVLAGEFVWYWSQSKDLSYRLGAMVRHNDAMGFQSNQSLFYRLYRRYPRMMLVPGSHFGLHSLLALSMAAIAFLRWRFPSGVLLLFVWATVPFLYLNFGTSSFDRYVALPAAPRYVSLVYPPLLILAATVLTGWSGSRPKRRSLVWALIAVTCAIGVLSALNTRGTGFRTDHVKRLKEIVQTTRSDTTRICEFTGPDGERWRRVLEILAPDVIGCVGPRVLRLGPDSNGRPVTE